MDANQNTTKVFAATTNTAADIPVQSTSIDTQRKSMDNMKPLIDAVSEDRREAAMVDEARRPDCRGARQGGQRGSSCGRHGRSGPPLRDEMVSPMEPPCGPSWGAPLGPPCERQRRQPCRSSCGPSCGGRCGPRCGQPGVPPFMYGSYGFEPIQCAAGPCSMHGPPAYGPMERQWRTRPVWAAELVDDDSDEENAGKENAKNAGKETHDPQKQQDGACGEKSGQQCPGCPWVDRMRRRRMRHANADCRRHDPCPMYRRCRREFEARSHCPPWSTVPGDCCQPGAPMGWAECPYPPPFFRQCDPDSAGESNSDPENDNQKQDGSKQTLQAFCCFSQDPSGCGEHWRPRCHGNGRGWQFGPPRNKLYQMLSWKRKILKGKLQRIESHLERLRPSEDKAKEATMGEDVGPEQASSMSTAPEAASPMDTHVGEREQNENGR